MKHDAQAAQSADEHQHSFTVVALEPAHLDVMSASPHPAPYQEFSLPCWEEFSRDIPDIPAFLAASLAVVDGAEPVAIFVPFRHQDGPEAFMVSWRILPEFSEGDDVSVEVVTTGLAGVQKLHADKAIRFHYPVWNQTGIQMMTALGCTSRGLHDIEGITAEQLEWHPQA